MHWNLVRSRVCLPLLICSFLLAATSALADEGTTDPTLRQFAYLQPLPVLPVHHDAGQFPLAGGNCQRMQPVYAPHLSVIHVPVYMYVDPYPYQFPGYSSYSGGFGGVPAGLSGMSGFGGGVHYRYPYYSYRRPWHFRGPTFLNRSIP